MLIKRDLLVGLEEMGMSGSSKLCLSWASDVRWMDKEVWAHLSEMECIEGVVRMRQGHEVVWILCEQKQKWEDFILGSLIRCPV